MQMLGELLSALSPSARRRQKGRLLSPHPGPAASACSSRPRNRVVSVPRRQVQGAMRSNDLRAILRVPFKMERYAFDAFEWYICLLKLVPLFVRYTTATR